LAVALASPDILFAGVISGALAFSLQMTGQHYTTPAAAGLILSTEAVFAAVFAAILLGERLGPMAWLGAMLILAGIIIVEAAPLIFKKPTAQKD
jgi:drug/metabolite transporter (DMT)-like permease